MTRRVVKESIQELFCLGFKRFFPLIRSMFYEIILKVISMAVRIVNIF